MYMYIKLHIYHCWLANARKHVLHQCKPTFCSFCRLSCNCVTSDSSCVFSSFFSCSNFSRCWNIREHSANLWPIDPCMHPKFGKVSTSTSIIVSISVWHAPVLTPAAQAWAPVLPFLPPVHADEIRGSLFLCKKCKTYMHIYTSTCTCSYADGIPISGLSCQSRRAMMVMLQTDWYEPFVRRLQTFILCVLEPRGSDHGEHDVLEVWQHLSALRARQAAVEHAHVLLAVTPWKPRHKACSR